MRIKIAMAGLLTALVLSTGGLGGAPAASAASGVSYCFRYAANLGGYPAVTSTSQVWGDREYTALEGYYSDGWRVLAAGKTNSGGCGSFNIRGAWRNLWVRVSWISNIGSGWYYGSTPRYARPGTAAPYLGKGVVYQVR